MSLLLRKQCQPILNEVGLGDYHTRINSSKYLAITGPCGKPLFSITGIEFVRNQPTAKEIEFAAELLTDFCAIHKASIRSALIAKKALFLADRPELPSNVSWSQKSRTVTFRVTEDVSLALDIKTAEFEIAVSGYKFMPVTLKELTKAMNSASIKKYTKIWQDQNDYANIDDAYENEITALQTCNI